MKSSIVNSCILIVTSFYVITNSITAFSQDFANYDKLYSPNGKLYAYLVMLLSDKTYYVNKITNKSISKDTLQVEGYQIKEFDKYAKSVVDMKQKELVYKISEIYSNPQGFNINILTEIDKSLLKYDVISKLYFEKTYGDVVQLSYQYLIFGKKESIAVKHPFFREYDHVYNVIPNIHYEEMKTTNSTFYSDIIYISEKEVKSDTRTVINILGNKNDGNLFFIGTKVNEDIEFYLKKAFKNTIIINYELKRMFAIHGITCNILRNKHSFDDQDVIQELALASIINHNPFAGLSILYSYLGYQKNDPHYMAAKNIITYISKNSENKNSISTSTLKELKEPYIRHQAKLYFNMQFEKYRIK